ncbi:MAG: preprotein translocase subunit SecE [Desulfocapsaceae bacterium]|nr:preprotein translocase subunit SecE [Desulfocapsaceae bacterium]
MTNKIKSKKNDAGIKEEVSTFSPGKIRQFFGEVKIEFTKIAWPDKKVTLSLTGIVVVLTVIVAAYLGSVDLLLGKLVTSFLQ